MKMYIFILLEYARLLHPKERHVSDGILGNAIGNVFSIQKSKNKKN